MVNPIAQSYIDKIAAICARRKPLVAIRCITYNHENYLRDALEGFVMQKTDFPFVAVVHDDASTDNTADILREYAEKYPDIILPIYESENQYSKPDGSLRRIMELACKMTGAKYIAMCEGDDYWIAPDKLQVQVDFLEKNPTVNLCYTDFTLKNQFTGEVKESMFEKQGMTRPNSFSEHLIKKCYIAPPTWMYRSANQYKLKKQYIDGTFAIALNYFARNEISYLPITTAVYRPNEASVSLANSLKYAYIRTYGIWSEQIEYKRKYTNLVDQETKIILNRNIFKLIGYASALKEKNLIKLAKRYSRYTKDYYQYLRILIYTNLLSRIVLKIHYKRKWRE